MPNQTVVVQKPVVKSTTNTFSKQGLAGPKGDRGEKVISFRSQGP